MLNLLFIYSPTQHQHYIKLYRILMMAIVFFVEQHVEGICSPQNANTRPDYTERYFILTTSWSSHDLYPTLPSLDRPSL
jgi:hypothetical protein